MSLVEQPLVAYVANSVPDSLADMASVGKALVDMALCIPVDALVDMELV